MPLWSHESKPIQTPGRHLPVDRTHSRHLLVLLIVAIAVGEGMPDPFTQPVPVQLGFLGLALVMAGILAAGGGTSRRPLSRSRAGVCSSSRW